jgi:hypothetical protein
LTGNQTGIFIHYSRRLALILLPAAVSLLAGCAAGASLKVHHQVFIRNSGGFETHWLFYEGSLKSRG